MEDQPESATADKADFSDLGETSSTQDKTSAPPADLHQTPTAQHAGSGDNSRLGLQSTPESASIYSSVSGESKPPSQKSTGMGFVRRLRRLSSAALHGKVNRLFLRSNPSQDSLVQPGPLSPSVSTSASPSKTAAAAAATPPPPPPLSSQQPSRRNRASTEAAPLAIRCKAEPAASDSPTKATNSPLIASPLSRKPSMLKTASSHDNINSSAAHTPTAKSPRIKSPKLIRSSSHTPAAAAAQPKDPAGKLTTPHRQSYQLPSDHDAQLAYQASQTPSPPARNAAKSQAHFSGSTPTLQRRRTALATLGWPESQPEAHFSPPPAPPQLPKGSGNATRKKAPANSESPPSILSAFQLQSRVPAAASSARSSISGSMHSWASALSDTDRDNDNDHSGSRKASAQNSLSANTEYKAKLAEAPAALAEQWPPESRWFYYPPMLDWGISRSNSDSHSPSVPDDSRANQSGPDSGIGPRGSLEPQLAEDYPPYSSESAEPAASLLNSEAPANTPPLPPAVTAISPAVRPRGGSQPIHLAKAATANAIRLKEKSAALYGDGGTPLSKHMSMRASPGSAPESFNIGTAIEKSKARLRMRATSASHQPINLDADPINYEAYYSASPSQPAAIASRPSSSMSTYTMSPISSSAGDDHHALSSHLWQPAGMFRSSPDRSSDGHAVTPSSTSSPPTHRSNSQSSHQLRLNMSSVQRSASGHSVSSGISELLEPSSVSMARKDALWQVLVVSKSRADTEIDKMMRQWRETDGGVVVCAQDGESKSSVESEDAIILKVKRGHRRSTSDMKRADGDRNEFRRRVIDLTQLIRTSSVSELSNEAITRSITEQLYGLLTEQRTRFPSDANIGTLILDVLYQFSAVSQTVSQLAMPLSLFAGGRGGISGDASPAMSQFPSPQLAPELATTRNSLSTLPPLTSTLVPHHEGSAVARGLSRRDSNEHTTLADASGTPNSSIGRAQSISGISDVNEHRISRTASEGPPSGTMQAMRAQQGSNDAYSSGSVSSQMQDTYLPGSQISVADHRSSASLPSAAVVLGTGHVSGRSGSSVSSNFYVGSSQRQRLYMPPAAILQPSRMSVDILDAETDVSSRPSLDDASLRPSLDRQPSQLSISSETGEPSAVSRKRMARASLQPQPNYTFADRISDAASLSTPKRISRPATMFISKSRFGSLRRVSDTASQKLAHLLSDDTDSSAPTSPIETPVRPYESTPYSRLPHATDKASHGLSSGQSASMPAATAQMLVELESQLHSESHAHPASKRSRPSIILEEQDEELSSESRQPSEKSIKAAATDRHSVAAEEAPDEQKYSGEELVVCRICECNVPRSELSVHSDMCILEQTRAMKLDEVNHRIKRIRDSVAKRLTDLKKARRWDKAAVRESERIIRIADRVLFWPVSDEQQELVTAKAKFAKYAEKLQDITSHKPAPPSTATGNSAKASKQLPRADIETLWLARQLLVRIREKREIMDELVHDETQASTAAEVALPTWSQLAQSNRRSPAASERTSMDFVPSQSESGSATPDVNTPMMLGKLTLSRRRSRPSRSSRRSLSRTPKPVSECTTESESQTSGSRKLVSLFAALFRSNNGFGRQRESFSLLRRKTPSLPGSSRSSSVLQRTPQPALAAAPAVPNTSESNGVSDANTRASTPTAAATAATTTTTAAAATVADGEPVSPRTRQRNNSQLSTLRGTAEAGLRVQRMPSIEDFDFVKPISRGAFGRVYLTRKKATRDLFAIKVMRKKDMINKNMVTQALAERRALSLLSTDWVVQLYYAFHSSKHLFLVMEYLVGGDLAGLLRVWGVMDEDSARFYIGEIACAIDYLHRNSIVHRDIKPDNVILASDGHIKLTDFGLSQVAVRGSGGAGSGNDGKKEGESTPLGDVEMGGGVSDKTEEYWTAALATSGQGIKPAAPASTHTAKALPLSKRAHMRKSSRGFLGTPDYLAPELLLGAGNGLAVDWWALGVCLFEFICGYPPFMDETPEAIFRNILNHAIDWPDEEGFVSSEAAELINALLRPEPATRAHWKEIQASKLYENWDLTNIRQREPPFVPQVDDDIDTSYFEACQRKELQRLSNATFLQIDTSPQLPQLSQQNLSLSAGSQSQKGSRRQRSASGSISAKNGNSDASQLKKLFDNMAVSGSDHSPKAEDKIASDGPPAALSESSSSDSFLMDVPSKRASVVMSPQDSISDSQNTEEHGSLNSLSDSDLEPTREAPHNSLDSEACGPASPPLQTHAKRLLGRSPSQCSDSAAAVAAGVDRISSSGHASKSHSRCASTSLTGRKVPRRPSQATETESGTAGTLLRSSSTDERLQGAVNGSSVGTDAEDVENVSTVEEENDTVFEDFTYKNLALLNHVNRGMSSSSGSASPMPERPPPGPAAFTMLVQWCMSAQYFKEAELQTAIQRMYGEDALPLQDTVDALNSRLSRYALELRSSMSQTVGGRVWALTNTKADGIATGATSYSPAMLAVLKHLIELVFTDSQGNFAIDLHTAVREATSKGSTSFTRRDAQEAIEVFCNDGWLQNVNGWVVLGQRACIELQAYLKDGFSDYIRTCALCNEMATCGVMCSCKAFIHPYCTDRLSDVSKTGLLVCPACRQPIDSPDAFGPGKPGIPH
ncbi:hypothetical protein EV183_003818 [Coemansia sp. RSA 2336]|nr:hypothetical protein EV183_003818 [Coemansia sp. RSA 2336]